MATQLAWEEQLIAEWLSLSGYFVETNVGLFTTEKGGLPEADVIAIRISNEEVRVRHLEVGNLDLTEKEALRKVLDKFQTSNKTAVIDYVQRRLDLKQDYSLKHTSEFVYTYTAKKNVVSLQKKLHEADISFTSFDRVFQVEIPKAIEEWKKTTSDIRVTKPWSRIVIPRKYRMLSLLDKVFSENKMSPYDE